VNVFLEDDDIKKLVAILAVHLKRQLVGNGGQHKGPQPRLLTVEEGGIYIGRTKSAVEKMIARHKLDAAVVRKNGRVHLDRFALDRWIENDGN
jgi:hypothetical protein